MSHVAGGGQLTYSCKCGGSYTAPQKEIATLLQEEGELLLACDSCSLAILVNSYQPTQDDSQ